jgi:hypothetical protein
MLVKELAMQSAENTLKNSEMMVFLVRLMLSGSKLGIHNVYSI